MEMPTREVLSWVTFYMELADKLLPFASDRGTLLEMIAEIYSSLGMRMPTLDRGAAVDIDPFTVFGLFNKGIRNENRISLAREFAMRLKMQADVPQTFDGVPVLNNQSATFYYFIGERDEGDIDRLWEVFQAALDYANDQSAAHRTVFTRLFDRVIQQRGIRWNLTMGLYWIRPYTYINLDGRNRWFLQRRNCVPEKIADCIQDIEREISAEKYLTIIAECNRMLESETYPYRSFPELSSVAWRVSQKVNEEIRAQSRPGAQMRFPFLEDYVDLQTVETVSQEEESVADDYTPESFLSEVYMSPEGYDLLVRQLRRKKNIILQGAPGVGKTFAAKRLAYSMMGAQDESRVLTVQFHQSYSYEDFVMGYRPAGSGFELKEGPFYELCRRAKDDGRDYFLIIDEINRGNMSKIFGELFMLIEADKRGEELKLMYTDERFSVPANVYIIGTMNTADRSLAILDFALRRRFAFFEFSPAFETEGFRVYQAGKNNPKFDHLIATVERLNAQIESDGTLGRGFRIGHSYFCTHEEIDDAWLNSIIDFELVPLLEEYWFDAPDNVRQWEHNLREAIR